MRQIGRAVLFGYASAVALSQTPTPRPSRPPEPTWMIEAKPALTDDETRVPLDVKRAREHEFNFRLSSTPLDGPGGGHIGTRTYVTHSPIAAVPTARSSTVLTGTAEGAQPHFAAGHSGVFTELTVEVEKYLKNHASTPQLSKISILYSGGKITNSQGEVVKTSLASGATPLEIGHKYVLFLNYEASTASFNLLRAWDISGEVPQMLEYDGYKAAPKNTPEVPSQSALEQSVLNGITIPGFTLRR